jgi:hypothetical protein
MSLRETHASVLPHDLSTADLSLQASLPGPDAAADGNRHAYLSVDPVQDPFQTWYVPWGQGSGTFPRLGFALAVEPILFRLNIEDPSMLK